MSEINSQPLCPICRKPIPVDAQQTKPVFCSKRCQTIDLGNWLSDQYSIPLPPDENNEENQTDEF